MKPVERETSSLRQTPPPAVASRLGAEGIGEPDLLLCAPTDIDRLGRYRREWLGVTRERGGGIAEDEPGPALVDFTLATAEGFRISAGVGSGLLQANVKSGEGAEALPVDILRFS